MNMLRLSRQKNPRLFPLLFTAFIFSAFSSYSHSETTPPETIKESYSLSLLGEPKYAVNFTHYDYVNPSAPKGGKATIAAIGTYDNFNRYALRGNPLAGSERMNDTLFTASEEFSVLYLGKDRKVESSPPEHKEVNT